MATTAHWHAEKTIACELIVRTLCCCRLASCLGLRRTYPSDYWFHPVEINDVIIPRAKSNYQGPEPKLTNDFVAKLIVRHCGTVKGYVIGMFECYGKFNQVLECEVDSTTGAVTMLVLPNSKDAVYNALESLTDRKGANIAVEYRNGSNELQTQQPQ
eukprot:TRINITY_DN12820_c0_g1_i1.p1 TRINITY_DN12820_c0_g1~~TRINITY_DN12820_c0_g1_i1.p1  ORF type:complete len:157 (+),score=11.76 TRINITY_DN12820_c0_g1_i1:159-629(+)